MFSSRGSRDGRGVPGVAVSGVRVPDVAGPIRSAVGSTERGKIRTIPIWMNSMTAARTGGMIKRLEMRISAITSERDQALEVKRGRVEERRRALTEPAISGVRGYSILLAIEFNCASKSISLIPCVLQR